MTLTTLVSAHPVGDTDGDDVVGNGVTIKIHLPPAGPNRTCVSAGFMTVRCALVTCRRHRYIVVGCVRKRVCGW